MLRLTVVLESVLCLGAVVCAAQDQRAAVGLPEKLVIAQHFFIDVGPPNDFYELIQLNPSADGVGIERVLITPEGQRCVNPAKVETRDAILHKTMSELLDGENPCTIPEKELHRELKRCKKCQTFSGMNLMLQATCAGKDHRMRMDVLERDWFKSQPNTPANTSWTMRLLEKVDAVTGPGGMDTPIFATGEQEPLENAPETATVRALREGTFDSLFGINAKVGQIVHEAEESPLPQPSVELMSATPFLPIAPAMPKYPPIARVARIEGPVNVNFDLDSSGKAENITATSEARETVLRGAAADAVANWKFSEAAFGHNIQAVLVFKLNCQANAKTNVGQVQPVPVR